MDYDRLSSQIYRQVPSLHPKGAPWWYVTAIWNGQPFVKGVFGTEEEATQWARTYLPQDLDWKAEPFDTTNMDRVRTEYRSRVLDRTKDVGLSLHRQKHVP